MNRGFLRPSFLAWPTSRLFTGIYQNVPPKKELDNEDPLSGNNSLGVRNLSPPPPHFCRVTSVKRQVTTSRRNRFFFFFFDGKRMVIHWWFYSVYYERLRRNFVGGLWLRLFVWGSSEFLMDLHNCLLLFRYLWNRESIFRVFFFFSCKEVCKFYILDGLLNVNRMYFIH